jgi:VIT family
VTDNDTAAFIIGIVTGVAGATAGGPAVLIAGLAGMLASALSMGSGAYLATKADREVQEAEIARERREVEQNPDEEREELALFYQLKGVPEDEAQALAARLIAQPEHALATLASEELGLSEQTFPNPWTAALSATLSTAFGAFIPMRCVTLRTEHPLLFGLDLPVPQSPHLGAGRQQQIELPNRRDTPVVKHDDLIGSAQRCPAVRDGENCAWSIEK